MTSIGTDPIAPVPSGVYGGPGSSRQAFAGSQPFRPGLRSVPNGTNAVGFDPVDGFVWFIDQTTVYAASPDGGTFSAGKGVPNPAAVGNAGLNVKSIIRHGASVFCHLFNPATTQGEVWQAAPAGSGNTAYVWAKVLTQTAGSSALPQCIASDGSTLLAVDYGDPKTTGTNTAQIWRSTDNGATWTSVYTAPSAVRHFHAVAFDPYVAGRVLVTFGDGPSPCMLLSSDSGATWTLVPALTNFLQSVSISFSRNCVFLAPDVQNADLIVMDRDKLSTAQTAGLSDHRTLAVPRPGYYSSGGYVANASAAFQDFVNQPFSAADVGRRITMPGVIPVCATILSFQTAATVTLSANSLSAANPTYGSPYTIERPEQLNSDNFYGIVDPSTLVYYGMANVNSDGTYPGRAVLFYIAPGGRSEILDANMAGIAGRPFIFAGRLWYGQYSRSLLVPTQSLT